MNCDAAIFDLDGTILDSLWVWEDISKDFLSLIISFNSFFKVINILFIIITPS